MDLKLQDDETAPGSWLLVSPHRERRFSKQDANAEAWSEVCKHMAMCTHTSLSHPFQNHLLDL